MQQAYSYKPLFDLLHSLGLTTEDLVTHNIISKNIKERIEAGMPISLCAASKICVALGCGLSDIISVNQDKTFGALRAIAETNMPGDQEEDIFGYNSDENEAIPKDTGKEADDLKTESSIDTLDLTVNTIIALKRSKIFTVKDLISLCESGKLKKTKNIGKNKYEEILSVLSPMLNDKSDEDNWDYLYSRDYSIPEEIKDISVYDMRLSSHLCKYLSHYGYETVGEVLSLGKTELYSIQSIGVKSVEELAEVIRKIEKEGISYFHLDPMNEPLDPERLRTFDCATTRRLVKDFGLQYKYIAEWYNVTTSRVGMMARNTINKGNWLNRSFTEEDGSHLRKLIEAKCYEYTTRPGEKMYFFNNEKDDCAVIIVNEAEIKCFYLKMLPQDIQDLIRDKRLDRFSYEELDQIDDGRIVSILKKEYFCPGDGKRFQALAHHRKMSKEEYCTFLTGLPLYNTAYMVSDERIIEFLKKHYKDGKIQEIEGESTRWFRSFIYRNGYKTAEIVEMYGL